MRGPRQVPSGAVTPRQRLDPRARRAQLVAAAAAEFAAYAYDAVRMERIAERAGVSRALLYRYFPSKRELFAAVFADASARLTAATRLDPGLPLPDQIESALAAHLDYFEAHQRTILTANLTLAGDPLIQAVMDQQMTSLGEQLAGALPDGVDPAAAVQVFQAWFVLVRILCVRWLAEPAFDRDTVLRVCTQSLLASLNALSTTG